jgi:hypothetical protein
MRLVGMGLALVVLGVFAPAASALTIDDFDEPQAPIFFTAGAQTATVFGTDAAPAGNILGGFRQTTATQFGSGTMSVIDGGSVLDLATSANVTPSLGLIYDGNANPSFNPTGLGGVNLAAAGPGLQFDANVSAAMRLSVAVGTDATHSSQALDPTGGAGIVLTPSATGLRHYTVPFSAFGLPGPGGPANFSSVGAVSLLVGAPGPAVPSDVDLTLDNLSTMPNPVIAAAVESGFSVHRSGTKVTKLKASGVPAGGAIQLTCAAKKGCPFKSKLLTPVAGSADLKPPFKKKKLKAGSVIRVQITAPGMIGKVFSFTARKGKKPSSTTLCLPPGAAKPGPC